MNLGKSPSTLWQMMKFDDEWKARLEAAVLAEREACAEICDRVARRFGDGPDVEHWAQGFKEGASVSAAKIRERGKE